jgi:two-component system sensor histidine kinase DegS
MFSISKRLIRLSTLSGLLAQAERSEDVFPMAVEIVADVVDIEIALIYSLDTKNGELVLSAYHGVPQEFALGVDRMKLGEGFNGRVAESGELMMVSDAAEDPRLSREAVRREGIKAQLVLPLKSRGMVVGTLTVASRQKREFSKEEVELLTAIANQIGIAIDRTNLYQEQLAVTELLRLSEAKYRDLFEEASDAILVHNMEGIISEANKACEKLLGYPAEELVGRDVREFLHGDSLALARMVKERLLSGEKIEHRYEQHIYRKDGSEAIIEMSSRLIISDGRPIGFEHIGRDVTEERKMRDNLRFYLKQVLRAQEEERKRLSRELHDDTSQSMLLLIHRLDSLASAPENRLSESVQEQLTELHSLAVQILDGLRRYAQELRPAILDDMGLIAALQWLADNINREGGTRVTVDVNGGEQELATEAKLVLFRIAQEALSNIKRHSGATQAAVSLKYEEGKITLSVADNGKGFELPPRLSDMASQGKLGLTGMEERARLLGGTLLVQSSPGKGTIVTAQLPLERG